MGDKVIEQNTHKVLEKIFYRHISYFFSEYNQQDETFLKFIYFCKTLHTFQTVFPSIIRSTKPHIQRQAFVRPLLLPAASSR
jgi:hypothetical protein